MDYADAGVTKATPGLRFAYREFVTPATLLLVLGISSSLIILYTFVGPLGARNTLNWNGRFAYCVAIGALCLLICYPALALTLYLARFRSNAQIVLALAAYSLIMAGPCGAIAFGVYSLFHGTLRPVGELPATYLICAVNILGATGLIYYVLHLVSRSRPRAGTVSAADSGRPAPAGSDTAASPAGAAVKPPAGPESHGGMPAPDDEAGAAPGSELAEGAGRSPTAIFLDRLPAHLGSDVVYVKVSGHYLEVITTRGSGVILQRLMDAVRELDSRGMQVHRSYWVAHRHVRYVVRRDRRTLLHLTGDYEVPVSRTFLPEVRRRIKPQTPVRHRALRKPEQ